MLHCQPGWTPGLHCWLGCERGSAEADQGPGVPGCQGSGAGPGLQCRCSKGTELCQPQLSPTEPEEPALPKTYLALSLSSILCTHWAPACLLASVTWRSMNPAHIDLNGFLFKVCQYFENAWVKFPFSIWKKRKMFTLKDAKGIQEMHRSSFQAFWAVGLSEIIYSICFDIRVVLNCRVPLNNFE